MNGFAGNINRKTAVPSAEPVFQPGLSMFQNERVCIGVDGSIGISPVDICNLYLHRGENFLSSLQGSFSLCLYDKEKRNLILARDRYGGKNVFYHFSPDRIVFANTMTALQTCLGSSFVRTLRLDAVADFLSVQYVPQEKTIYEQIFKLLPGHCLTYSFPTNELAVRQWYFPERKQTDISYGNACNKLKELLLQSIRIRLKQADDLGLYWGILLSGGIDSAIVTSLLASETKDTFPSYTAVFRENDYNELDAAMRTHAFIESFCGRKLPHKVVPIPEARIDLLEWLVEKSDNPFADASLYPFAEICKTASEQTAFLFTGDGADELFFGYDRYIAMRLFRLTSFLPCRLLTRFLPQKGERTLSGRLNRFFRLASQKSEERYFSLLSHFAQERFSELFYGELAEAASSFPHSFVHPAFCDAAESAARFDFKNYLPDDILVKSEYGSRAAGVEIFAPFLSESIVDFAQSLPVDYKLHGKTKKRILKDTFREMIPEELLTMPKRGFGVPIAAWLRNSWYPEIKKYLLSGDFLPDKWFRRDTIQKLICEHKEGQADHSYLLYSLLVLALFVKKNSCQEF